MAAAGAAVWPLAFYVAYKFDLRNMRKRLAGKPLDRKFYGAFAAFGFVAGGVLAFGDMMLSLYGVWEPLHRLALIPVAALLVIPLILFLYRRR